MHCFLFIRYTLWSEKTVTLFHFTIVSTSAIFVLIYFLVLVLVLVFQLLFSFSFVLVFIIFSF